MHNSMIELAPCRHQARDKTPRIQVSCSLTRFPSVIFIALVKIIAARFRNKLQSPGKNLAEWTLKPGKEDSLFGKFSGTIPNDKLRPQHRAGRLAAGLSVTETLAPVS
jgi:hypothetical protein